MIENWSIFQSIVSAIQVHLCTVDDKKLYRSSLVFILDEEDEHGEEQVISIFTDMYDEDAKICGFATYMSIHTLFEEISNTVLIIHDGDVIDTFELDEVQDEIELLKRGPLHD